jgi:hypothetical protein
MMIKPDREDIEKIEREYGPLPHDATVREREERHRICQSAKLNRLWEEGRLPLAEMRAMDKIARGER